MPKGWEERIQHHVFEEWLVNDQKLERNKTFWHEYKIPTASLVQGFGASRISLDFIIDRGKYYEIVECKRAHHPTFDIGSALGYALVYSAIMRKNGAFPNKKPMAIRLSLCCGANFGDVGPWTDECDDLMRSLSKSAAQKLSLYLVRPKNPESITKADIDNKDKFCVSSEIKEFAGG